MDNDGTENLILLRSDILEAHDLLLLAEDVSIVLLKAANTRETLESSTVFIPMQNSKVGESHRQFLVRTREMAKHETMSRTNEKETNEHNVNKRELEY